MDSAELPVALYDFLYRDPGRISSYYAQLFNGQLKGIEKTASERTQRNLSAGMSLYMAKGDAGRDDEVLSATRETFEPGDIVAVDVLAQLREAGTLREDVADAPNGAFVGSSGTLFYFDRHMLEMAQMGIEAAMEEEKRKPKSQRDSQMLSIYPMLKKFMGQVVIPSAFMLQCRQWCIVGTIKDEGMEEPIPGHYFKHGMAGLEDVHLIGIKEKPTAAVQPIGTQLIGIGQPVAQALTDMLFPPDSIRVTPIALLRKLPLAGA